MACVLGSPPTIPEHTPGRRRHGESGGLSKKHGSRHTGSYKVTEPVLRGLSFPDMLELCLLDTPVSNGTATQGHKSLHFLSCFLNEST